MSHVQEIANSHWPHRWAVVLVCATFPLLWIGGLVTTTDAGMAVPDWPSTYGYNLFLYPLQTWLAGPWDIFVEHGHRLLGAAVGMITICLLATLWLREPRRWLFGLGIAALALVIFQGVLGGMRVLLDERTLAMLHGCTGPVFFALATALAVFTSRRWQTSRATGSDSASSRLVGHWQSQWHPAFVRRLAVVACVLVYLQIVLGAILRHVPVATEPATFALAVRFHLFMAAAVTLHIAVLVSFVLFKVRGLEPLRGLALSLAAILAVQLALGAGTWVVKFSVPTWVTRWVSAPSVAIQDGGWLQTHVTTAHVAVGSLLLATSVALALYAQHLLAEPSTARFAAARPLEGAL